jgi:outer membrane protein assembly factor BamB
MKKNLMRENLIKKNLRSLLHIVVFASVVAAQGAAQTPTQSKAMPELVWQQALGGNVLCPPSYQIESLVAVCDGGRLPAFSVDGKQLWEYKAGGKLLPYLMRSGTGTSYICRANGMFIAVNRIGRSLWQKNLKEGIAATPLIGWDGRIFICLSKKIICLNASGLQLWQIEIESPVAIEPVLDKKGGFVTVLKDATLLNVNAFGKVIAMPLPAIPAFVAPIFSSMLVMYSDGKLEQYEDTVPRGNLQALPSPPVAVAEYENKIAIHLANGNLVIWSHDGGIVKTVKTNVPEQKQDSAILYDADGIVALGKNAAAGFSGNLEQVWDMPIRNGNAIPAFGDNIVFVSGKDWILNAYQTPPLTTPRGARNESALVIQAPGDYGLASEPAENWSGFAGGGKNEFDFFIKMIARSAQRGDIGEYEPFYTKMLFGIASASGKFSQSARAENLETRIESIKLLGKIGSQETIHFLAKIFLAEQDLTIKSAAAEAMGLIGQDPNGEALNAFAALINSSLQSHNDRLLCAIAAAIGRICRFSGPPLSAVGIPLLVAIKNGSPSARVDQAVQKELNSFF